VEQQRKRKKDLSIGVSQSPFKEIETPLFHNPILSNYSTGKRILIAMAEFGIVHIREAG
jgi:hypothetical protein